MVDRDIVMVFDYLVVLAVLNSIDCLLGTLLWVLDDKIAIGGTLKIIRIELLVQGTHVLRLRLPTHRLLHCLGGFADALNCQKVVLFF